MGSQSSTDPDNIENPLEELILELNDPRIWGSEGRIRISARARFLCKSASGSSDLSESYIFTAPLGPMETQELQWYLEKYHIWPAGPSKERAERVERQLPNWGKALYEAAFFQSHLPWWKLWKVCRRSPYSRKSIKRWLMASTVVEKSFSVTARGYNEAGGGERNAAADRVAEQLLSLPWELIHNGDTYLLQQDPPIRINRRMPGRDNRNRAMIHAPIRVLLVNPRPEDEHIPYADHRIRALPLISVAEDLGDLAEVTVLYPPTFAALRETLERAAAYDQWFDVLHFDGCGTYDEEEDIGYLCFEDPEKSESRRPEFVSSETFARLVGEQRIPLVFLEVQKPDTMGEFSASSLAGKLLRAGSESVVITNWRVMPETARKFLTILYRELVQGGSVGKAMLAGQNALMDDPRRGRGRGESKRAGERGGEGAREFALQDWFVPVLYQTESDPRIFVKLSPQKTQEIQSRKRRLESGHLPDTPVHDFVGRSRELLKLERILYTGKYAVVRGQGGIGKTALAVELAYWLLRISRFQKAMFVAMDTFRDMRGILDSLGKQISPEGEGWTVASYDTQDEALTDVGIALRNQPTLIVLDNLESIMPDASGNLPPEAPFWKELFDLCERLLEAHDSVRIVFTSRESLPEPFGDQGQEVVLGAMEQAEAIDLVSHVMSLEGWIPGDFSEGIQELVEAANCHPRALVLLAREVSRDSISGATRELKEIMADLDRKYPGDRELSLYASLELSLRRLKPESQELIKNLAVVRGGISAKVLCHILDQKPKGEYSVHDEGKIVSGIFQELEGVGLGEYMGDGYLHLDPALPAYLAGKTDKGALESLKERWAEGMEIMNNFLYDQYFQNTALASRLILLELPNLLEMLNWILERWSPERGVDQASKLETLLARLGRPGALAQANSICERAAEKLEAVGWNHARFLAETARVERMLDRRELPEALDASRDLLKQCLDAGESAYPEAVYDLAVAHFTLGKALRRQGRAEESLEVLGESRDRFQLLAEGGNTDAQRMVSVSITEMGSSLRLLGRLVWAARAYEEAIKRFEDINDTRSVAAGKERLGTIRMYQNRDSDALRFYEEAQDIFEALRDPVSVAGVWHKMGVVYRRNGNYHHAEEACKKALTIHVQQGNRTGEAGALNELGNLYDDMGRLEDAAVFYLRARDVYAQSGDRLGEGRARSNAAIPLIRLRRYDEARRELERALECKSPMGHTAQPWRTWNILYELELATGNQEAASNAREMALKTYLDYRKAGGESQSPVIGIFKMVSDAIRNQRSESMVGDLPQFAEQHGDPHTKALIPRLRSILKGDRTPSLADSEGILYMDAVELQLLLEELEV